MKFGKLLLPVIILCVPAFAMAQQEMSHGVEMADVMRSNGKIYVVVTVVTIIMTGLIIYLFSLDRKLRKYEKKISDKNQV